MWKTFCFLLLWGISALLSPLRAQETSLLWRISGNGLEFPSFLFGTIHIIPKDSFFFPSLYAEKLDSCRLLVTEVKMDMSFADQLSLGQQAILPDGKTLRDYMKPEEYARFYKYHVDTLGISPSKMAKIVRLKPIFGSGVLLMELLPKTVAYEKKLVKMARKRDMKNYGLETTADQMNALNKISIKDQLPDTASYTNYLSDYYGMLHLYRQQLVDSLYSVSRTDTTTTGGKDFDKILLDDRNASWIKPMEQFMEYRPTFFAVGAAHLGGEKGVISLLRKRGYTVTPVYAEPNAGKKRK